MYNPDFEALIRPPHLKNFILMLRQPVDTTVFS